MSDKYFDNYTGEDLSAFSVDDILSEYGDSFSGVSSVDKTSESEYIKKLVSDAVTENISSGISPIDQLVEAAVNEVVPEDNLPVTEEGDDSGKIEYTEDSDELAFSDFSEKDDTDGFSDIIDSVDDIIDDTGKDIDEEREENDEPKTSLRDKKRKSVSSGRDLLAPVVGLLSVIAAKRQQKKLNEAAEKAEREIKDVDPKKAQKSLADSLSAKKQRLKISLVLCLIASYISLAYFIKLPVAAVLRERINLVSLLIFVLSLSSVMTVLDVFTEGILDLFSGKPTFKSLASISVVLSAFDAVLIAAGKKSTFGIPFCAPAAFSLFFAALGDFFKRRALLSGVKVLGSAKNLYTVSADKMEGGRLALFKTQMPPRGFVPRGEDRDYSDGIYYYAVPALTALCVILGLAICIRNKTVAGFFHHISVMISVSAVFSGGFCVSLPTYIAARKLSGRRAAIAGPAGLMEIGKAKHTILVDEDIFPAGTLTVDVVRTLEGALPDKVMSYTASVIAASGSGLANAFAEMMKKHSLAYSRVEGFRPMEGGGITAAVNGEWVQVGSAAFMNLMGVRIPAEHAKKNVVYSSFNGILCGMFVMKYMPTAQVQESLVQLLRSRRGPVFAVRDFNVTPQMLKKAFRLPTDNFNFPPYIARYPISSPEAGSNAPVAAIISGSGVSPLVDISDCGKRLYSCCRLSSLLSICGSVFGVLLMYLLLRTGAYDSAGAANAILFLLVWSVPNIIVTFAYLR